MAKQHIIPLFIPHLGCPNGCVFCDQKKITGMGTSVTPEMVAREIVSGLEKAGGPSELAFYGGSFTAIPVSQQEALLGAAEPWRKTGELTNIRVSTRPDAVDGETVARLKSQGVTTVELGCQSMDGEVLRLSRRGHSPEDTIRAAEAVKAGGLKLILQMMTGLPGDTPEKSLKTAEEIIALRPGGVRIYPTVVLRDTELHRMMERGEYRAHSVEDAVALCAILYQRFLEANIPVIRLGLNPTELLSSGDAVAGAYHPALGEKVLSRMYLTWAKKLLSSENHKDRVIFSVHPSRVSVMVGQKRENFLALSREFSLKEIKVLGEGRELWEISLKNM